jgi:hypothetical protein
MSATGRAVAVAGFMFSVGCAGLVGYQLGEQRAREYEHPTCRRLAGGMHAQEKALEKVDQRLALLTQSVANLPALSRSSEPVKNGAAPPPAAGQDAQEQLAETGASPETEDARAQAEQLLAAARQAGTMAGGDLRRFQALTGSLPPSSRDALNQELSMAVNDGSIVQADDTFGVGF